MRSTTLLIGCIFVLVKMQGQNLVLNPSFEEKTGCPNAGDWSLGSIDSARFWTQPHRSADYFYPCGWNWTHSTPQNALGYQQPRSGIAYAGIYCYEYGDNELPDGREYIEGQLSVPLLKDSVYKVEFFVSLAEDNSSVASDFIGAYLSDELIKSNVTPPTVVDVLPFIPQVSSLKGEVLADSVNWTRICGYFKAAGDESFITIGNYLHNSEITYLPLKNAFSPQSYYYIDDVSVEKSSINPYQWVSDKIICTPDSVNQYALPDSLADILWSTGDTTHAVSLQGPGTYWVRAALDGCYFTDTFQIEHTPAPAFGFSEDTLAVCNSALPLTLETTDCCAEVLWSTGDTTKTTEIGQEGLVWIRQQNLCGTARDSFWLQVDLPPLLELGADTALCDTAQFSRVLQAPVGLPACLWSTGDTVSAITATQPGVYWLTVQNACGIFTDTIVFKDLRQLRLTTNNDTILCLEEPLLLSASSGFDTYLWSTGENTNEALADDYGLYIVRAANDCGTQTDSIFVTESNHPQIQLPAEVEINLGDSIALSPLVSHDKPLAFHWSPAAGLNCPACESPLAFPWQTTDFLLIAQDSLRCRAEAEVRVRVVDRRRIYVPNVFSPNGDGQNDFLTVFFGNEVGQVVAAAIYDRWGSLVVWKQNLPAFPETVIWDGAWQGRDASAGVYALVLSVRLKNGETVQVAKDVTLVR